MFTKIHKRMKSEKGFTLIELLVVIIIIAILAAIAIPTFLGQRQKAQDAAAKSLVRNAMTAIESAYVDTRTFDDGAAAPITNDMLGDIEPSITFTNTDGAGTLAPSDGDPAATVDAQLNAVGWDGMGASIYGVGCESQSGKTFSVVVNKSGDAIGDNDPGNTFYIDGAEHDW